MRRFHQNLVSVTIKKVSLGSSFDDGKLPGEPSTSLACHNHSPTLLSEWPKWARSTTPSLTLNLRAWSVSVSDALPCTGTILVPRNLKQPPISEKTCKTGVTTAVKIEVSDHWALPTGSYGLLRRCKGLRWYSTVLVARERWPKIGVNWKYVYVGARIWIDLLPNIYRSLFSGLALCSYSPLVRNYRVRYSCKHRRQPQHTELSLYWCFN